MQVRVAAIIAGAALVGLLQAGCSSESSSGPTQPPVSDSNVPGASVNVVVTNFAFEPATVEAGSGANVVWTVEEGTHEVLATDGAQLDSGTLTKGNTFTWSPESDGTRTVLYQCKIHPSQMQGTITVNG